MKNLIIIFFIPICFITCKAQSQNNMQNEIKEVIIAVENAAAKRDTQKLSELLHNEYRVIANRFKGTKNATIISKEIYLKMMTDQKIGGTSYNIVFNDIKISDHTAMVDILYLSNTTSNMHKYLVLIQDENNNWKIVSDIPVVKE